MINRLVTFVNDKQAKHFEIEGELWAFSDMGWRNGSAENISLLYQDGLGFVCIEVNAEGNISRSRYDHVAKRWETERGEGNEIDG